MRAALIIPILLLTVICSFGQEIELSNLRAYTFKPKLPQQQLDSLSIIPSSLEIFDISNNSRLDTSFYHFENNFIVWDKADIPPTLKKTAVLLIL